MPTRWFVALGVALVLAPPAAYAQQTTEPVAAAEPASATAPASAAPASAPADATAPAALNVNASQDSGGGAEGFVAKMRRIADDYQLEARLNGDIDGWYPRLGRITRGSGFAIGPGYRLHPFGSPVLVDLSAGFSIKGYYAADAGVRWIQAWDDKFELWTDARYEHFPQEDFYGLGNDSLRENQTSYEFDSTGISLRALGRPTTWLEVGSIFGYLRPRIGPGSDSSVPSLELLFADVDAPGLDLVPKYLHTTVFAEVDRRDLPGNPGSGGVYRTSFGVWDDHNLDRHDHRRLDALAVQHVPLNAGKTHILSGRIGTSYVNNETGQRVPFYFLAYVGGVDTIRSYDEFRFKDENALWLGAEYRWMFHKYGSVVTFVDAGKVERDWQDLTFTGLKKGYGFGFRAHTRTQTLLRLDFGFGGGEGFRSFLKVGPSF